MLWEPQRHVQLEERAWNETVARDAIARIVDDAVAAFDGRGFPVHPLDEPEMYGPPPATSLYSGAAGVVWAIERLRDEGFARPVRSFREVARTLSHEPSRMHGFLIGRLGAVAASWSLGQSRDDELAREIESALGLPSNELMLGAPGAALVATLAHARSGSPVFAELARKGVEGILAARDHDGLYTQHLLGGRVRYLGLVHGFAGNAAVLLRARSVLDEATNRAIEEGIVAAALSTVVREGDRASWPAAVGEPPALMQICHGAPGMVVSLASVEPLRDVLLAAGNAIDAAGPLAKGTNLCHGDAGNAFAFLALHAVTGDRLWLARARAFAMNAIRRCDEARTQYRQGRHSLWTGDLGLAWFLTACIRADPRFPTLDFL